MDNRFYFVDYEEAMATEIDLFWERDGGDESPIGLSGVVFEITTETSPEVDSPIEWMICTGVSLVSGRVGAHMAVAVFAFLAGLVMYLLFLGIYSTIEYIYKESTRGVERD